MRRGEGSVGPASLEATADVVGCAGIATRPSAIAGGLDRPSAIAGDNPEPSAIADGLDGPSAIADTEGRPRTPIVGRAPHQLVGRRLVDLLCVYSYGRM